MLSLSGIGQRIPVADVAFQLTLHVLSTALCIVFKRAPSLPATAKRQKGIDLVAVHFCLR
jgi:hypothetical protein